MCGLLRKVESDAGVIPALGIFASDEERLPGGFEGPVEGREELECAVGKELCLGLRGYF